MLQFRFNSTPLLEGNSAQEVRKQGYRITQLPNHKIRSESGYVLLALLLIVALLSIGLFTTIQRIDFQIKRDREEELIHRGVQYSRAVRKYFKAFGRYPTRKRL